LQWKRGSQTKQQQQGPKHALNSIPWHGSQHDISRPQVEGDYVTASVHMRAEDNDQTVLVSERLIPLSHSLPSSPDEGHPEKRALLEQEPCLEADFVQLFGDAADWKQQQRAVISWQSVECGHQKVSIKSKAI
jgi:hypothetical protein